MLSVGHASDLAAHSGRLLGHSDWRLITRADIDDFARISGDDQWIHVDPARAARELPGGRTIAHGLFLLSLIPALQRQIYTVRLRGRGLNYGYDRVRFIEPVPVGSRVRLCLTLVAAAAHALGTRIETDVAIECEGLDRPAVSARNIVLIMNP
jgi:acyl dehydratase